MAKQAIQPTSTMDVVLTEEEALAREYAGAGVSDKAADNIVPQIRILQPLSPGIVEGKFPDAKPGDFLVGTNVIKGQDGLWFQPCYQGQIWLEFQPLDRGGGFVASYPYEDRPPQGAKMLDDYHYKMGDNELIHYRQWAGLAWINQMPLERVIAFKSTGHTVARNWNTVAREANRLSDGTRRPLFGHIYKLTTERSTNAKGTWYQFKVGAPVLLSNTNPQAKEIVGENPMAVVALGAKLYNAFAGGERRAEVDQRQTEQSNEAAPL